MKREPEKPAVEEATEELLELVLSPPPKEEKIEGILIGRLLGLEPPMVAFPGGPPNGAEARAMATNLTQGGEVALMFEGGDPQKPVILGPMARQSREPRTAPITLEANGERVEIEADQELVLRCGEASITLTKEGKVLIKGAYLSSRSTGLHRIQGGTIEIN